MNKKLEKSKKTFVIIDGHAIIHRAYHALPPMMVKDGTMVNAVYGFTSMLLKVINDLKPDYLAVSFDVAGGTFRDEVYDGYKAHRVKADQELYDQIPLIYEVVQAFGIPIYVKEGFEADDVIGTISSDVVKNKKDIINIIVTGDKDLLQLVDDDRTEVYLLRKGMSDFHLYNEKEVYNKFGFGPDLMVDYKALRGDSSDNIPGIKGIGEKIATQLITQIGDLLEIYKQLKDQGSRIKELFKPGVIKKLEEGKEDAMMSQDLATIRRDVKDLDFILTDCRVDGFDRDTLSALLRKFEFYSLVKRIPGSGDSVKGEEGKGKKTNKKVKSKKLVIVKKENSESALRKIKAESVIACKEILSGDDVLTSDLVGLVFVTYEGRYFIEKPNKDVFTLFEDKKKTIVGHGIKQLVKALQLQGVDVAVQLFDIKVASYLLNSSTRAHDIKAIALRELGKEVHMSDTQGNLFGTDPQVVADELSIVFDVHDIYVQKLEDEENRGLFDDIEMALIPVLADMELNGIAIDIKLLKDLSVDVNKQIKKIEKNIYKEAGEEFNVASSTQLRHILFETLKLPTQGIKKGKTGYSTSASELEKLRDFHTIISYIEEYREVEKLRNTYIDVLPTLLNKKTGRIHTDFNQAVTTTGRLSSSNPNLQNIPIRTELGRKVREAFVSEKGNVLVAADYSQIELRVVASLAEDETMINIFKQGEDIHKATAAVINNVKLEDVTKKMRSAAKAVNFGVLYGMGAYGLASRTGISNFEAKEFIEKYFKGFKDVKKYLDNTLALAKKEGYVETLFGRRRYIPELQSGNPMLRKSGERMAINMPVQGTAADLMKMAMIAVSRKLKVESRKYKKGDIKMILQVHDEIVLEVRKDIAEDVAKIVKEEMEGVATLRVPIGVDVEIGTSWGKLK